VRSKLAQAVVALSLVLTVGGHWFCLQVRRLGRHVCQILSIVHVHWSIGEDS